MFLVPGFCARRAQKPGTIKKKYHAGGILSLMKGS
jgi:hypothetical protein